jgi:hypothetical protein
MAESFKGNLLLALFAGAVAGALVPVLRPAVSSLARPAAKGAIRAGLMLYGRGREAVAELAETTSDIVAELQAELENEQARTGAAASPPREGEQVVPIGGKPERKFHG